MKTEALHKLAADPRPLPRLEYIDVARGVAILMVIATHAGSRIEERSSVVKLFCSWCELGVQLFFFASALTLCMSTAERNTERFPYLQFAVRRILRIAPLYYIGIPTYVAWRWVKDSYMHQLSATPEVFDPSRILMNFTFIFDLFPKTQNVIVPGGWSVSVEMMFYAVFPIIFSVVRRSICRASLVTASFICLNISIQVYMMNSGLPTIKNDDYWYFLILNQMPVFCIGIWYFCAKPLSLSNLSLYMLSMLITIIVFLLWDSEWPIVFGIIPSLSALAYIPFLELLSRGNYEGSIIGATIAEIGRVSFSMYLFHFILMDIFVYILHRRFHPLSNFPDLQVVLVYTAVVISTYAVAFFTYRFIERPGMQLSKKVNVFLVKRLGGSDSERLSSL